MFLVLSIEVFLGGGGAARRGTLSALMTIFTGGGGGFGRYFRFSVLTSFVLISAVDVKLSTELSNGMEMKSSAFKTLFKRFTVIAFLSTFVDDDGSFLNLKVDKFYNIKLLSSKKMFLTYEVFVAFQLVEEYQLYNLIPKNSIKLKITLLERIQANMIINLSPKTVEIRLIFFQLF